MGRTFHRHQSHRTRILSTDLLGRTRSPQLLEHQASSEVLPISCQKASSRISNFNKETWSFGVQFKHPRQLQESLLHRLPRIPTFLCSLKVKGTANRVVGAKGHDPCGPRDKFSTTFRSKIWKHELPPKGILLQEFSLHQLPRIPTFLCSLKVKGTANRVVGAKGHDPCGPRDKFSTTFRSKIWRHEPPSQGVTPSGVSTPLATSNTNLFCSLKVKGTANRVVGAKGHDPCGPRDKFSTTFSSKIWRHELPPPKGILLQEFSLHQLSRIPTFLCSLKVKGMANRVVGAKGHDP